MAKETIEASRTPAGIPVITIGPGKSGRCGYMVAVRAGSRDEAPGNLGISHLLEHSVFRRAGGRTSFEISRDMEAAGGSMNAFTSKEMTGYHGSTILETAGVARELVGDIVADPSLDGPDIELEKKIVLQEISMWENDPESYIHKLMSDTLWEGHGLSQNEAGLAEVVDSLGEADLREYYGERYGAPSMVVIACGDAPHDETVGWAEERFDPMGGGPRRRVPPKALPPAYVRTPWEGGHCYVGMGFQTCPPDHADHTALGLLGAILGAGASSRLFHKVREESALVYSVYSVAPTYSDAASMETYFSSTPKNVLEAIEAVASVWRGIKDGGLADGELRKAKNMAWGRRTALAESTDNTMYSAARQYMVKGEVETMADYKSRIESVTGEDVMRVAGKYLDPGALRVAMYGTAPSMEGFSVSQVDF
ncbi:MAG: insulinase family protein [Thermoplasmatales archaeon]|nr:insulinase family protein [Thermoplasmatales archaeon]